MYFHLWSVYWIPWIFLSTNPDQKWFSCISHQQNTLFSQPYQSRAALYDWISHRFPPYCCESFHRPVLPNTDWNRNSTLKQRRVKQVSLTSQLAVLSLPGFIGTFVVSLVYCSSQALFRRSYILNRAFLCIQDPSHSHPCITFVGNSSLLFFDWANF